MIKVICYNKERTWEDRNEAIRFYRQCAFSSEGSEQRRYVNILSDLYANKDLCVDDDEYFVKVYRF